MHGTEGAGEEFLRLKQVVDVGAGVILRDVAAEFLVDAAEVALETRRGEVHPSVQGVDPAAAPQASRCDAVEGVRTRLDGREQIVGLGNAEQVPRLVLRQLVAHPADDGAEVLLLQRAANTEAAEPALAASLRLFRQTHQVTRGLTP